MTLALVMFSGNPTLDLPDTAKALQVGLLATFIIAASFRRTLPTRADGILLALFIGLVLVQVAEFGADEIYIAELGFLTRLLTALLFVRALHDPWGSFLDVMYSLAAVSLLIYITQFLLLPLDVDLSASAAPMSLLADDRIHIGIHNFNKPDEWFRNSGVFWEPGAYAGYLILALLCLAARKPRYALAQYRARLAILVAALATTLSTTGYLLMPFVIFLAIWTDAASHAHRLSSRTLKLVGVALVMGAALVSSDLPFLGQKMQEQLDEVLSGASGWETTRFGSAVYDSSFILQRPLFGWSPHPSTRATVDPFVDEILRRHGNGLTTFCVQFGLVGLVTFLIAAAWTLRSMFNSQGFPALIGILVVAAMLNGEQFLNFPLLFGLMFRPGELHFGTARLTAPQVAGIRV